MVQLCQAINASFQMKKKNILKINTLCLFFVVRKTGADVIKWREHYYKRLKTEPHQPIQNHPGQIFLQALIYRPYRETKTFSYLVFSTCQSPSNRIKCRHDFQP